MDITRRTFLKGAAAGCALCVIHLAASRFGLSWKDITAAPHTGPCLLEGLTRKKGTDGGMLAVWEGETVFSVNREGAALLEKADGSRSLEELCGSSSCSEEAVADFFLTLAQAGWLQDRLEVYKIAVEA